MLTEDNDKTKRSSYIVSLKYTPGSAKEFKLLGSKCQQFGWRVAYLLSRGYSWMVDEGWGDVGYFSDSTSLLKVVLDTIVFPFSGEVGILQEQFQCYPPQFLCMYNRHPLDIVVARLARSVYPEGVRAIFLHEPYVPDKSSYGKARALYIHMTEQLLSFMLRYSTCVIVPSIHAQWLFTLRYPNYPGQVYLAPLLLPDNSVPKPLPRRFITFVGNINKSRNLNNFFTLINNTARNGDDLEYCIVTRSPIADAIQRLSDEAKRRLTIINKPVISDDEIANVTAQSIAMFLPHKQAAQSGNIPVAFRGGTPVIARDIPGLSQHVRHKENGYLFPFEPTPEQLLEAVDFVRDNFSLLSQQAREDFENIFLENNWERYYHWLLEERNPQI